MSNELTMNEIISELDRINFQYDRYESLKRDRDNVPDEYKAESDMLRSDLVATLRDFEKVQDDNFCENRPLISHARLAPPPEEPKKPDLKNPAKDILVGSVVGLSAFLLIALTVISIVIPALGNGMGLLAFFLPFAMIVMIGIWFYSGAHKITTVVNWQKAQKEWEEKQAEWATKFNKSANDTEEYDRYINDFKKFDSAFLSLVDICSKKYAEEFDKYMKDREAISDKYTQKLDDIGKDIEKTIEELYQDTIIHPDLFEDAWRISSILKAGRADTLRDAINLALDEKRKDMEEAARREEARRAEAILEQQAWDNRMHNQAMARAAEEEARAQRAHNAAMERAAQQQAQAAEAQAREAAKQNAAAAQQVRDARRRCGYCANASKCSMVAKNNAANCAAYRPR